MDVDDMKESTTEQSLAREQARINAINWYHEFDFPCGLKARSHDDVEGHRTVWAFIERQLDGIDFSGKSVLDIGCWDGKWSFYAERRGAARVLASDDATQNWGRSEGLLLAKELFGSAIETKLDVSIYALDQLGETFDVILCLGVYYHLIDPFYGFAQVRHRCNERSVVVFEGTVTTGMRANTAQIDPHALPIFLPTPEALANLLKAAYLEPVSQIFLTSVADLDDNRSRLPSNMNRAVTICRDLLKAAYLKSMPQTSLAPVSDLDKKRARLPPAVTRAFTICQPYRGANETHIYRPPFGLAAYDPRF
jgi:tRNA (mo5U34)-methyltransferase